MAVRVREGDVYQIPLPDGRFAFAHYLLWSDQLGCLMRVFDFISSSQLESEYELQSAGELFPPVFVGLKGAVKVGRWKKIGFLPVPPFRFPQFRSTSATKPGTYENWWLWEGGEQYFIGKLPPALRSLEFEVVWGYEMLENRIATGKNVFAEII
jgi:hypothetical protein